MPTIYLENHCFSGELKQKNEKGTGSFVVGFMVKNYYRKMQDKKNGGQKMARHGENIRKRTDGRWEGRYKVFDENRGKYLYRSIYGRDYEETKEKLFMARFAPAAHDIGKRTVSKTKGGLRENTVGNRKAVLFSQVAGEWLTELSGKRKISTCIKYDTVYRIHLAVSSVHASFPPKWHRNCMERFLTTYRERNCRKACKKVLSALPTRSLPSQTNVIWQTSRC